MSDAPRVGMRFRHQRVLTEDRTMPALYEVTKIQQGVVYFHRVDEATDRKEKAGECCALGYFHKLVICEEQCIQEEETHGQTI